MSSLGLGSSEQDRIRARERRGRRAALVAMLVVFVLFGGLAVGGLLLVRRVLVGPEDYPGPGTGEVVVRVEPGDSATAIGRTLEAAGVVKSTAAFRDAAEEDGRATSVQPGFFRLRQQMGAADAFDLLLDPASRVESVVTVREGLRLDDALDVLARGTGIPRKEFEAVVERPAALGLPDWANGDAEGLLFPATYTVLPDATATEVLAMMVRRFRQAAAEVGLERSGGALSPRELVTMASLVEAEAPPSAMPRVAAVLYNRLAEGMRLQLDSTVNYANGTHGITTTPQQRANPSPYNTYAHEGLPPGPINAPGEAALRAAVTPAEGPWVYFVTVNPDTGETKFAVAHEQHQRNVDEFRRWLRQNGGR